MKEQVTLFSKKPVLLSLFRSNSTVLVFAGTVLAYVIAILYETAYLSAYGLPPDLIEISPVIMFYSALLVVTSYIILELFSQFEHYFSFKEQQAKKNGRIYMRYLFLILNSLSLLLYTVLFVSVLFVFIVSGQLSLINLLYAAIVFGFFSIIIILIPIASQMKEVVSKRSIKAGLTRYFKILDSRTKTNKVMSLLAGNISLYIFFLIITTCIPVLYGGSSAKAEKEYFVYTKSDTTVSVVVRHYGLNTIIKDYDIAAKKFKDGFTVASSDQTRSYPDTYTIKRWK